MKVPSLHYLKQNAVRAVVTYPFSLSSAFVAVCVGIYLTEFEDSIVNNFPFINLMLCMWLGIGLFFCVAVFSRSSSLGKRNVALLYGGAVLLLLAIYFTLPGIESSQNTSIPYIRYAIFSITVHLLVAFIPFLKPGRLNGFWHYNRILFVRFIVSGFYSAVLYGGLALALGSLDFLFDVDLHEELFLDLFILIGGLFNTWFFLAGIPKDLNALDDINEYPKGIKIFAQYVLLPLLILYLVILYAYAGKIVFLWSWPKGIVSYLIACVAVLGILSLLLLHPYGNLPGNSWIRKFSRIYYFILFPLIALMFIAIGMRVEDYGITINRYCIILLGIWLTIICAYFAVGRTNIKFIPISLAVMIMAVSFGYWGMFSVSERSQVARLKSILTNENLLVNDKIVREVQWRSDSLPDFYAATKEGTNENVLEDSLHHEVKSILDYLDDHHGFSSIRSWYDQDLNELVMRNNAETKERWMAANEAEVYMRTMGLNYVQLYDWSKNAYFGYSPVYFTDEVIEVSNYQYLLALDMDRYDPATSKNFALVNFSFDVHYGMLTSQKMLLLSGQDTLVLDMDIFLERLIAKYGREYTSDIPRSEMVLEATSEHLDAKFMLNSLQFIEDNDTLWVNSFEGDMLVRIKGR